MVVALARPGAFDSSTAIATATGPPIADAGPLEVAPLHAGARRSTGQVIVAAFADLVPGPTAPKAGTYAAEIAWGDGTMTAGPVSVAPGADRAGGPTSVVKVSGKHTDRSSGTYAVVVALARPGLFDSSTQFARVT